MHFLKDKEAEPDRTMIQWFGGAMLTSELLLTMTDSSCTMKRSSSHYSSLIFEVCFDKLCCTGTPAMTYSDMDGENVVNSRPLTKVSIAADDEGPNKFLLESPRG